MMRLAQIAGSQVQGTLQIAEHAINEMLARSVRGATQPTVELQPGNTVLVRYGMVHAHAQLPSAMPPGASPRLTLRLASLIVAFGLKAALRQPFVHVHGRQLTIDVAEVPALSAWRDLWKHLHQLTFETAPGALRVGFIFDVREEEASGHARMV